MEADRRCCCCCCFIRRNGEEIKDNAEDGFVVVFKDDKMDGFDRYSWSCTLGRRTDPNPVVVVATVGTEDTDAVLDGEGHFLLACSVGSSAVNAEGTAAVAVGGAKAPEEEGNKVRLVDDDEGNSTERCGSCAG